ncbi:AAA family ATPase [Rhodococcus sp. BP-349]|uniref:AAA family ATPase n=1 Tax=unclassified Rhodococcus (in: high G+C Gram-positive bacteria) TaxID=192944 RepID=UPI001C9B0A2F|nr:MULTISPECIES: AAA family ATPase [unclassified Rhodococcus (in: high G+C Gram-positive bacteria)]MBY6540045.1 AAA family ATPase [Rhodococcus sp. BP-363]MBY6543627.1 AAA family ATPase [Rhodococcus sp. BP-369]MBY6562857.1 AAA family ATPase [Rhodococcus sp. BP-370]MBY6577149.1 AAA family ATPase [Rhodococcus sp. BP-364]MBY6586450.1 AAA family ATPase [Rhodococcus sp. BP-358]
MNHGEQHELHALRRVYAEYQRELTERSSEAVRYAGPRNGLWTGTGLPQQQRLSDAVLLGRVELFKADQDVLNGRRYFYVGGAHAALGDVEVFNWTAPIACAFFGGRQHHDLCSTVAGVRTLLYHDGVVSGYVDDVSGHRLSGLDQDFAGGSRFRSRLERSFSASRMPDVSPRRSRDSGLGANPTVRVEDNEIRNPAALHASVTAPKSTVLASHLATLQREQYDLVTAPAMHTTLIEGPPGCGKTVIAVHRAAYVVSRDTPPENSMDGNVLLLGPTRGYVSHVASAVSSLADSGERIRIQALPGLMQEIAGLRTEPSGSPTRCWRDADFELGRFAQAAVTRARNAHGEHVTAKHAFEQLRRGLVSERNRDFAEWTRYLRQLPSFARAATTRAYLPLLAILQWSVDPDPAYANIEHIIVDEAQDLTALEWFFVHLLNETRQYTLLGDLNQRRSDHTPASWESVMDILEVEAGGETRADVHRGYRSTQPILDYAARLLPRESRRNAALRADGPAPEIVQTRSAEVGRTLVRLIEQLVDRYPDGTVAIIAHDRTGAHSRLQARGWTPVRDATWCHRQNRVEVHDADSARGLEFDAVVVLEPADFRRNLGRSGPLYTSLTRANKKLVVLHAKPLPTRLEMR